MYWYVYTYMYISIYIHILRFAANQVLCEWRGSEMSTFLAILGPLIVWEPWTGQALLLLFLLAEFWVCRGAIQISVDANLEIGDRYIKF